MSGILKCDVMCSGMLNSVMCIGIVVELNCLNDLRMNFCLMWGLIW